MNESPNKSFVAIYDAVTEKLELLNRLADDHFGSNPDKISWGDVADLERLNKKLEEILELLQ